jgi:hypothetical protein
MPSLFSVLFANKEVGIIIGVIFHTAFIWLPIVLLIIIWDLWIIYRRAQYLASLKWKLLEIKLPREVFKSPLSMEIFFNSLYQTGGEGDWWVKLYKGQTRATFSLELTSIDGSIHFFIHTQEKFRNVIEASLYSQFPGIEIYDVEDYTLPVSFDPEKIGLWANEFKLEKADSYPIKTYIDYGMEKDPKEEYRIDPMTPLVEFMGALGREHQVWIQIIIRAHKDKQDKDPKTGEMVDLKWKKSAEAERDKILKGAKGEMGPDKKYIPGTGRFLTDGENQTIKALDRSVSKIGFDVGIRAIYFAPKDVFVTSNNAGIIGGFRNFNSNNLNGFKATNIPAGEYEMFPFIKRSQKKINREKRKLLDAYKHRGYFYNEFKRPSFVLNTEELATIFHFPAGGLDTSPSFTRIGSKKSEAPNNLPI